MWIVVGLGNPGPRYAGTRHNIGFRLLDRLGEILDAEPAPPAPDLEVFRARREGPGEIILVKPLAYMNRSGPALLGLPESRTAEPYRILVAIDDVNLPFGAVRFRPRGGPGGHRGLESILAALGTEEVPRLRLGVGGGEPGRDLAGFVLEPFTAAEESRVGPWLDRAARGVLVFLDEGPEAAMGRFNRVPPAEADPDTGSAE